MMVIKISYVMIEVIATNRVDKLSRATSLSSTQQAVEMGRVQEELRVKLSLFNLQAITPCVLNPCQTIDDAADLCSRWREVAWQVSTVHCGTI